MNRSKKLRVLNELTQLQKRDVLEKLRTGKMSMREVASEYGIALSTLDGSSSKSRRRRMRKTVNAEVNELMFQFFVRCRAKLIPITGQLLQTMAIDIARRMGINDFHASNGCLESFTRRHNIKFRTISGEAAAVKLDDEANVHECTEGTADEIVEELLSKSNAKEVLSEEVEDPLDEKLTYSEA
ncbi:Tigger transposable element-derived protein 4 [Trichinella spiralis]|uniref:Tigger transposable element-derived protein 4 n=2 Tax=Trichinella spiralis TaxID=6334 RepID=A0A0V1AP17_TRISP|nr:Tigger transposable element-derived protein 4 [Trichinella spiralis]